MNDYNLKERGCDLPTNTLTNSTYPLSNQVSEVFPPLLSWPLHLLSLRSCLICSLSAHTIPHIHATHIIFTIITQTIATELAFHSSKIVQRHATPASNGSVIESDNQSKTRPIWAKTLSIYTRLQYPWSATSLSFDNYICIRPSSAQDSDAFQIWVYKDQKDQMDPLHGSRVLAWLLHLQPNSPLQCLSLSDFTFQMLIALAWLATSAAERLQLTNNADHPHNWLFLTMHLSLLLCYRSSQIFSRLSCRNPPRLEFLHSSFLQTHQTASSTVVPNWQFP